MASICRCGNAIHPVRIKLNYSTCVKCSTTEAYGCAPIINHKTGNSIQIMSQSQAAAIRKASRRKGYGTCLR
jgi:hypothetical protein